MIELPSSWVHCRLGDVVNYGSTRKAEPDAIPADAWVLELEDIEKDTSRVLQRVTFAQRQSKSTKNCFEAGDVLYGKLRPYLNKVIRADQVGFCTTEIVPLKPSQWLDGGYLFYWLKHATFLEYAIAESHGLSMPRLGTNAGRDAPFVLAPFTEQRRIAQKLDLVFARMDPCRDRLDRMPANLKRFRQSVLAAATAGKLTEEWRGGRRTGREVGFEWEPVTLGDLCESSFYGPRFGRNEYTNADGGVPTIRTTDMTNAGRIEITEETPKVVVPIDKMEQFRVRKGDLLITRTGSIGVMAVFEDDYMAIPSAYLIRFRFFPRVLPRFVFLCLMAPRGQEQLGLSATAITQPNINAEAIRRIEIKIPSLDEQSEIVRRVDTLFDCADRLEALYAAARTRVERLAPALLAKAFRGDLVPQDPNDEPASVLLERIRVARAELPSKAGGRKQRSIGTPHAPQEKADMTKSRHDVDVMNKPYLAGLLREAGGTASVEDIFKLAELSVTDFYKQLALEVEKGYIRDDEKRLETA